MQQYAGVEDPPGAQPMTAGPSHEVNPGDDAPAGTPGTGEVPCPDCQGSGQVQGRTCQTCAGTGKVVKGVGGA
ncbi:hypothetical protein [Bordetella genomosp. 13]|uniref:hypothetical protein n=1 Tax=Bordetella genomosp. 13 TaxID=463040 RepID=UPI0011A37280|nr:hypothetical protein [Bordetella genomosp. 13]